MKRLDREIGLPPAEWSGTTRTALAVTVIVVVAAMVIGFVLQPGVVGGGLLWVSIGAGVGVAIRKVRRPNTD